MKTAGCCRELCEPHQFWPHTLRPYNWGSLQMLIIKLDWKPTFLRQTTLQPQNDEWGGVRLLLFSHWEVKQPLKTQSIILHLFLFLVNNHHTMRLLMMHKKKIDEQLLRLLMNHRRISATPHIYMFTLRLHEHEPSFCNFIYSHKDFNETSTFLQMSLTEWFCV